mmetsp:Transcript_3511/g.9068  ORF Transcript_3511/g.9068 Transcript_3511/m.9068 type:complete len:286 (-) Transcript_3511:359-1216(-)
MRLDIARDMDLELFLDLPGLCGPLWARPGADLGVAVVNPVPHGVARDQRELHAVHVLPVVARGHQGARVEPRRRQRGEHHRPVGTPRHGPPVDEHPGVVFANLGGRVPEEVDLAAAVGAPRALAGLGHGQVSLEALEAKPPHQPRPPGLVPPDPPARQQRGVADGRPGARLLQRDLHVEPAHGGAVLARHTKPRLVPTPALQPHHCLRPDHRPGREPGALQRVPPIPHARPGRCAAGRRGRGVRPVVVIVVLPLLRADDGALCGGHPPQRHPQVPDAGGGERKFE